MYKSASRAMQHAHGVDRPHPSRGYVDGSPDPADVLPDVSTLTLEQLLIEQKQLRAEVIQTDQMLAVANATRSYVERGRLGHKKAVLSSRLSVVNKAVAVSDATNEVNRLRKAICDIADKETADRIFTAAYNMRS